MGVLCSILEKRDNDAILYNEFVAQAIEGEDVKGKEMTTQNTTPSRRMMLKKEKNKIIYLYWPKSDGHFTQT